MITTKSEPELIREHTIAKKRKRKFPRPMNKVATKVIKKY